MRAYILVGRVINGETLLHYLGGIGVYYLSGIPFEQFDDGYKTKCRLGMRFVICCIVNLDFYVTLCSAFYILIVANDSSHLGIKTVSWSWRVGVVTKTPDISDNIEVNYLFFTREKSCSSKATRSITNPFLISGDQMY